MLDNKEYHREFSRRWRLLNKEKIKEYNKRYNQENKDILLKWKINNEDKIKEYNRDYRKLDKIKEYNRDYRKLDKIKEYRNNYNKIHKEKYEKQIIARRKANQIKCTNPCEICGSLIVQRHHPDYNQPMNVVFLCQKDHHELHRLIELNDGRLKNV